MLFNDVQISINLSHTALYIMFVQKFFGSKKKTVSIQPWLSINLEVFHDSEYTNVYNYSFFTGTKIFSDQIYSNKGIKDNPDSSKSPRFFYYNLMKFKLNRRSIVPLIECGWYKPYFSFHRKKIRNRKKCIKMKRKFSRCYCA